MMAPEGRKLGTNEDIQGEMVRDVVVAISLTR